MFGRDTPPGGVKKKLAIEEIETIKKSNKQKALELWHDGKSIVDIANELGLKETTAKSYIGGFPFKPPPRREIMAQGPKKFGELNKPVEKPKAIEREGIVEVTAPPPFEPEPEPILMPVIEEAPVENQFESEPVYDDKNRPLVIPSGAPVEIPNDISIKVDKMMDLMRRAFQAISQLQGRINSVDRRVDEVGEQAFAKLGVIIGDELGLVSQSLNEIDSNNNDTLSAISTLVDNWTNAKQELTTEELLSKSLEFHELARGTFLEVGTDVRRLRKLIESLTVKTRELTGQR